MQEKFPSRALMPTGALSPVSSLDLALITVTDAALLLATFDPSPWLTVLRAIAGFVAVLVAPGYVVARTVHLRVRHVPLEGRWFLTLLFSLGVSVSLAMTLAYLGVRLDGRSVALGLSAVTGAECAASVILDRLKPVTVSTRRRVPWIALLGLGGVMITLAGVTILMARAALRPAPSLYLTSQSGFMQDFPYDLPSGTAWRVRVHATSLDPGKYRLVEQVNGRALETLALAIHPSSRGGWTHAFWLPTRVNRTRLIVEFALFHSPGRAPLRSVWVRYWTGTTPPPTP